MKARRGFTTLAACPCLCHIGPGGGSEGAAGTGGSGREGSVFSNRRSVAPRTKDEAAQMVSKLGSQRINNIFTHLRKICQHPLLVRHHFNDDKVKEVAEVASANRLFGGNCTVPRVLQEISGGLLHCLACSLDWVCCGCSLNAPVGVAKPLEMVDYLKT